MLVARLDPSQGTSILTQSEHSGSGSQALELKNLITREKDKPVCQHRAYNFELMLKNDFRVEWRGNNWKLGIISPKIVGRNMPHVIKQMKTSGCQDGGVYFVASNAYFWLKNGANEKGVNKLFVEESSDVQGKILEVKDKVLNVIYDDIENIELTMDGLKDSFGHELKWEDKSKPVVNLKIRN